MSKAKRWIFTLNNYNNEDVERIKGLVEAGVATYLTFGYETAPTTGTPHLQGYICFVERRRLQQVKDQLGERAYLEVARGTPEANRDYCQKEGCFEEEGDFPVTIGGRGQDGHIRQFTIWFENFVREEKRVPTEREWSVAFPHLFIRYPGGMRDLVRHLSPEVQFEEGELKQWQLELKVILTGDADDRTVIFIVDPEGGAGKTYLQRWMLTQYPDKVQVLSMAKRDDVAHAVDCTKEIFMFNIPRGGMEFFQYTIVEQIKDRMVFSPKYNSRTKLFRKQPHVCVFCNEEPDLTKMTRDRYFIHYLS